MSFNCQTHQNCIDDALNAAQEICTQKGVKLTKNRRRILELIWGSHAPVKAYDLLAEFQKEDSAAKPATIYRTLDFLQENGLIHKIHRLNAYIGCIHPNHGEPYFLLICSRCTSVSECQNMTYENFVQEIAKHYQFQCANTTVEIEGICKDCNDFKINS